MKCLERRKPPTPTPPTVYHLSPPSHTHLLQVEGTTWVRDDELRPVPLARACSSCFIPDPTSLVRLGPRYSTQCFIPDPTSLCSVLDILLNASSQTQPHFVRSLYFKLNASSQTQPHFVRLGPCISNSMLIPRPNLTLFG
ncbi:hypothetical protein E4T56_gene15951 [Termitomyces sp. T112]|nr:hypothetical protein E4T56_gene15951 [Termitomyces sp. T112]